MRKSHLTNRTHKYRPITKLTASAIALSILFSPLELPLSDLASHPEDFFVDQSSAKDIYEQNQSGELVLKEDDTITFTRTLGETDTASPGEAVPFAGVSPFSTELIALAASIEPEPVAVQRLMQRSKRGENILAAKAIAEGDTYSELAAVALDAEGNIIQTKDLHGAIRKAEYDEAGRPVLVTNADGSKSYYSYNSAGQLTGISHEPGASTESLVERVVAFVSNPLVAIAGNDTNASFSYDQDNIAVVKDGTGTVAYEYDEDGLLISETNPDGSGITYSYDELGNVVETEAFLGESNRLSFESFLQRSYASPLEIYTAERAAYNDNNKLSQYAITEVREQAVPESSTPAVSTSSLPVKDTEQLPATTTLKVQSATVTASSTGETEAPVEAPLSDSVIEQIVTEVTETIAQYLSNTTSQVLAWIDTSLTRAWAEVVAVTTDTEATTASTTSTTLYQISYTYDAQGNVIESTSLNGVKTTYQYDPTSDALLEKTVTTPTGQTHQQSYQVDNRARIVAKDGVTYEYTDADMLKRAGATTYTYDEAGNRVAQTGPKNAQYTYIGNRLITTTYESGRTVSYDYDERGAVRRITDSEKGVTELAYSPAGAVSSLSQNGQIVSYTYDAMGRRVSRISGTDGTWTYQYQGNKLKQVLDGKGVVLREYFYTPTGELTAVKAGESLYQVIVSDNKSIVGLVSLSTGELFTQSYDVWGAVTKSSFPFPLDIGYIGAFAESQFGFSILGPRVYDPELGRFLSKDPLPGVLVDGLSQNEYIYAKNDPVHQYDPTGHASEIAQKSDSPKRAIVETKAALELLRQDEEVARKTYADLQAIPRSELTDFMSYQQELLRAEAAFEAAREAVESLEILLSLQQAAVAQNEQAAVTPIEVVPQAIVEESSGAKINAASTSEQVTMGAVTKVASTTIEVDNILLPTLDAVTESESTSTSPTISKTMFGGVLAVASIIFSDKLLKAEAKKKKSKARSRNDRQRSSARARNQQNREAKNLASIKKQLNSIEQRLLVLKVVVDKRAAAEKEQRQKIANAINNIGATTGAQIAKLNQAPEKPATFFTSNNTGCGITMSCPPASAGVSTPILTYQPAQTTFISKFFAPALSTGISLIPIVGEGYDLVTILSGKDPITQEQLTSLTKTFTVIGLLSGYGSGKVARDGLRLALASLAGKLGVDVSVVTKAAEDVVREDYAVSSLEEVYKKKGLFNPEVFLKKVESRVAVVASHAALMGARSIPEFLAVADARKIADASAGNVKVLYGTADDAKAVFEAQTKGWEITYQSDTVIAKMAPDKTYSVGYRTKSTDPARGSVTKINGTIDIQRFEVFSNGHTKPIGGLVEIKFAQ